MRSFWEYESFYAYDVIIVGGGITGLSSAVSLKEMNSSIKILVLERGLFPQGASTKNAGFACFGSLTEIQADIQSMGLQQSMDLVAQRFKGLQKLRERFGDLTLGYHPYGGYELLDATNQKVLHHIDQINEHLHHTLGRQVFEDHTGKMKKFGFNTQRFTRMLFNPHEGQLDTGKTMSALIDKAGQLGVKMVTGAWVKDIQGTQVQVRIEGETTTFEAKKIVVASNGFARQLLPQLEVVPGRGQVIVTSPIENLPFMGTFHMDQGYFYFRNVGNRVLFGGGRNLAIEQEQTYDFGINPKINQALKSILKSDILPQFKYDITHEWSGIMAFGDNKTPIMQWISPEVYVAVKLSGMGMALGSYLGEKVAKEMLRKL